MAAGSELAVTAELRRELGAESPLHRRLRAIREVGDKVLHVRVQEVSDGPALAVVSATQPWLEYCDTVAMPPT